MSAPEKRSIDGITGTPVPSAALSAGSSDAVKSARRVLDVFEFFYRVKRPARAVEIASFFEIPKSSANGLLKTLVDSGYLTFNLKSKSYFLSFRLVSFGNWLSSFYFGPNRLTTMMEDLREQAGQCVALTVQNGLYTQFVMMLPAPGLTDVFAEGRRTPILGSATGGAVLMILNDDEVTDLVHKATRGKTKKDREADLKEVRAAVHRFRAQGYAVNYRPPLVAGTMTLAIPLPRLAGNAPLILSLGGLVDHIAPQEKNLVELMRECIAQHLTLDRVSLPIEENVDDH